MSVETFIVIVLISLLWCTLLKLFIFYFCSAESSLPGGLFPGCSRWGLLFIGVQASHRSGLSCCGAQAPGHVGSVVVAHGL